MLSCLCPKIQWKNWSINVTVYLKLVYIEFAKNVAHNYRVWLELLNIFCIIFIHVLHYVVMRTKNGLRRLTFRSGDGN